MRKVVLFIAMSLDGFIADKNGGVDWLYGQSDGENEDVYSEFVKNVDTIIMGRNTYDQITTELSPDNWVYGGFTTYVITHNVKSSTEEIHFTDENPAHLVNRLRAEDGKDIWICGGADLIRQLMRGDMIDQYYISVIPTLLGSGIRLFGDTEREIKLKLLRTRSYNGITDLVYTRR